MTGEEEAAPELACMWCERTGQEFKPCCDQHPDRVVCANTADCAAYSVAQSKEIERRHGLR